MPPEKSATSLVRPSLFAPCRLDRARTRPCWSSATRMRIQVAGCSKTRASCLAAIYGGGAVSGAEGSISRRINAGVAGLPVGVPTSVETTATGAAILAAVGAGLHGSVAEAAQAFVSSRPGEQSPDPERREIYDVAYARYRELYFALKPVFANAVREKSAVPA